MKTQKQFIIVLILCILVALANPTSALATARDCSITDTDNFYGSMMLCDTLGVVDMGEYNEYDYILDIQTSTPSELSLLGLSSQKASTLIDSFYDALDTRASMTDDVLEGMGYNSSEIAILRTYASGGVLTDAEMRAATGTCTGTFTRHSVTTTTAEFSYSWEWDHCPLITLSDSSAMTWLVYESDGDLIGVEQVSKSLTVNYAFEGKGLNTGENIAFSEAGTEEQTLEFNTLNMQFPVHISQSASNGIIFDYWAKSGTVKVKIRVPSGVEQTIHHIFVGGLYGHTVVGIGSPSVSIGSDVSIGFSGNTSIDPIGGRKATLYRTSSVINYWND